MDHEEPAASHMSELPLGLLVSEIRQHGAVCLFGLSFVFVSLANYNELPQKPAFAKATSRDRENDFRPPNRPSDCGSPPRRSLTDNTASFGEERVLSLDQAMENTGGAGYAPAVARQW